MIPVAPALNAPASPPAATPADSARALIEGQMAMLSKLAQIGMEIAEECGRQARGAEPASLHDTGLIFARVARAVRMTIALQSRLAGDLAALDRADDLARMRDRDMRRMRLRLLIRRAAEAEVAARRDAGDPHLEDQDTVEDGVEQLTSEAYERLTEAEDFDLEGRPFHELVAGICKDLGMSPDWTARLTAAAGPPEPPARTIFPRAVSRGGSPVLRPGPEDGDGGFGALLPDVEAQSPLHHASRGPPPPPLRAEGGIGETRAPP